MHERHLIHVKQEIIADDSSQLVPTTSVEKEPRSFEKHIVLERWIIKPLGDGICVEGHRRLSQAFACLCLHCSNACWLLRFNVGLFLAYFLD